MCGSGSHLHFSQILLDIFLSFSSLSFHITFRTKSINIILNWTRRCNLQHTNGQFTCPLRKQKLFVFRFLRNRCATTTTTTFSLCLFLSLPLSSTAIKFFALSNEHGTGYSQFFFVLATNTKSQHTRTQLNSGILSIHLGECIIWINFFFFFFFCSLFADSVIFFVHFIQFICFFGLTSFSGRNESSTCTYTHFVIRTHSLTSANCFQFDTWQTERNDGERTNTRSRLQIQFRVDDGCAHIKISFRSNTFFMWRRSLQQIHIHTRAHTRLFVIKRISCECMRQLLLYTSRDLSKRNEGKQE